MADRPDDGKWSGGFIAAIVFIVSNVLALCIGFQLGNQNNWRSPFVPKHPTREQQLQEYQQRHPPIAP